MHVLIGPLVLDSGPPSKLHKSPGQGLFERLRTNIEWWLLSLERAGEYQHETDAATSFRKIE